MPINHHIRLLRNLLANTMRDGVVTLCWCLVIVILSMTFFPASGTSLCTFCIHIIFYMKKKLNIKFRKINVITHWCISLSTALCNFCSSIPCWEKEIHYKFVPKDALLSRWGTVIISSTNRVCPNKIDIQRFLDIKIFLERWTVKRIHFYQLTSSDSESDAVSASLATTSQLQGYQKVIIGLWIMEKGASIIVYLHLDLQKCWVSISWA